MIKILDGFNDNVLAIEAIGNVTGEDYENVIYPKFNEFINSEKEFSALYYIGPQYKKYEIKAIIDDAKLALKDLSRIQKIAVVTDVSWIKNMILLAEHFTKIDIKIYNNDAFDEAKKWINT